MKIAFLGNFSVDYSSESHYLRTLRELLGHQVVTLQEGVVSAAEIEAAVMSSDMLLWVHTHGWHTLGMAEVLVKMKAAGIPSVGYHLDLWKGLKREADIKTDAYWGIEYFFTVDKLFVEDLQQKGIKAYYLPAGVFEKECYIGKKHPDFLYDVVFVGSREYHPEHKYRTELIEWLERTYGNRFAQFGRGKGARGVVRGKELNDLYASANVVVGDTLCIDFKYPFYLSDRIFETTGRGGFLIHPYITGIEDLFQIPYEVTNRPPAKNFMSTSEAEVVTYPFGNFEYLKYVIDYYLENKEEREAIRMRGFERTRKDHTYTNRLKFILDTVSGKLL